MSILEILAQKPQFITGGVVINCPASREPRCESSQSLWIHVMDILQESESSVYTEGYDASALSENVAIDDDGKAEYFAKHAAMLNRDAQDWLPVSTESARLNFE